MAKKTNARKFIRCTAPINRNAVKREIINGIEHIVVTSFTMPDNVIMNRVLYPAAEIHASFMGLDRTLAPLGHPTDVQGNFISASDPDAINNFYAGAYNVKPSKSGSRIKVEKTINVQEALKTDRGKRLLDRVALLEKGEGEPIHTSTGIFLELKVFDEPQTDARGQEFDARAFNLVFDHDAILLDEVGASTPEDGVGMAVNMNGDRMSSEVMSLSDNFDFIEAPQATEGQLELDLSVQTIMEQLREDAQDKVSADWLFVVDLVDDIAIIETNDGLFRAPYGVNDITNKAILTDALMPVDRVISYQSKVKLRDNAVKDLILNALKAAGVRHEDLSDEELLEAYKAVLAANATEVPDEAKDEGEDKTTTAIAAALAPMVDQLKSIQTTLSANETAQKEGVIQVIVTSGKYPGLTAEDLANLSVDRLSAIAVNSGAGFGLPIAVNEGGKSNGFAAPTEMPA